MKKQIFFFLVLCQVLPVVAQQTKLVKTYHDFYQTNLHEEYSVTVPNGLKHGRYREWTGDGVLSFSGYYKNGELHGTVEIYGKLLNDGSVLATGKLMRIRKYINGSLDGIELLYSFYGELKYLSVKALYITDHLREKWEYWPNKQLGSHVIYEKGKGGQGGYKKYIEFEENYNEKGELLKYADFYALVANGKYLYYYDEDYTNEFGTISSHPTQLKLKGWYDKDNNYTGEWLQYYPDGSLWVKKNYSNKAFQLYTEYNKQGVVLNMDTLVND